MLETKIFDDILRRAGIDIGLVSDLVPILQHAEDCYYTAAFSFVDGLGPLTPDEKREILNRTADCLVRRLQKLFHEERL